MGRRLDVVKREGDRLAKYRWLEALGRYYASASVSRRLDQGMPL